MMLTSVLSFFFQDQPEVANLPISATEEMGFMDLYSAGGIVSHLLAICSLVTVYVITERAMFFYKNLTFKGFDIRKISPLVEKADFKQVENMAYGFGNAIGRIIAKGAVRARKAKSIDDIGKALEGAGAVEVAQLEKRLGFLGIIAGIAPILGFIGTISGIIKIFYGISLQDNMTIGSISGGLYEKMFTSAAGLVVGGIAYLAYHAFNIAIDHFVAKTEIVVEQYLDDLYTLINVKS